MTREHIFFLPFVLSLGFIAGALVTRDAPARPAVSARPLLWAGLLLLVVFVATHALGTHGGARQIRELLAGQQLFDQHPSHTASEVYLRIAGFGAIGREAYARMTYTSDLVFPLALFHLLFRVARHVTQVTGAPVGMRRLAVVAPCAWLAADLVENASIHSLLTQFPARSDALAGALGVITDLKFSLLVASVVIPAALLATVGRKRAA